MSAIHNKGGTLSIWLAFSILILSAGLVSHVMAIPVILGTTKRDAWLSVLGAAPFFLVWLGLIGWMLKRLKGQRLPDWIRREFGIVPAWIFRIGAVVVLFMSAAYTLHDTSMWTIATYMQQTPISVIVVTGAFVSMLSAYMGIRSIAMTSSILLPFVILLGYFVMSANTKYKDYSLLFPILEEGPMPAVRGIFYVIAGLLETWILLLYQHELKRSMRWWHLPLLGLFLISMTLGPTIGAITEFGPLEAAKQRLTAFEQWKILSLGDLLQHVDFLSIYQWICGSFARVAISIYLIGDMMDARKPKHRLIVLSVTTAVMAYLAMQHWRDDRTLDYLQFVHMPAMVYFVCVITLLLCLGMWIKGTGKEKRNGAESGGDANDKQREPAG